MNIKSQLAPKGLEFKPSEFIISDKYATIMSVISRSEERRVGKEC